MLRSKRAGRLPDFICIGAQKAGTTTLNALLAAHPDVQMARGKELDYFVAELNLGRGEAWYRGHFGDAALCGECSPNYTNWPRWEGVAERMHALVPRARLIYCVRDPVARAVSSYKHFLAYGLETRPVDEALGDDRYIYRSLYHAQVDRFLHAGYRMDDILVVESEELRTRREAMMGEVLGWIGATVRPLPALADRHASDVKRVPTPAGRALRRAALPALRRLPWTVRPTVERTLLWPVSRPMAEPRPSPATVARLRAALAEDVARFRRLTGRRFEGWSV